MSESNARRAMVKQRVHTRKPKLKARDVTAMANATGGKQKQAVDAAIEEDDEERMETTDDLLPELSNGDKARKEAITSAGETP